MIELILAFWHRYGIDYPPYYNAIVWIHNIWVAESKTFIMQDLVQQVELKARELGIPELMIAFRNEDKMSIKVHFADLLSRTFLSNLTRSPQLYCDTGFEPEVQLFYRPVSQNTDGIPNPPIDSLTLRPGTMDDFRFVMDGMTEVFTLEGQIGKTDSLEDDEEHCRKGLKIGKFIIVEDGGRPIAFLGAAKGQRCPVGYGCPQLPSPFLWVSYSYTIPEYRRSGIARWLYSLADKKALENEVSALYLNVYFNNTLSMKFHEHVGFRSEITILSKKLKL
jgi:GNAT superfamily N-acetyltransferase